MSLAASEQIFLRQRIHLSSVEEPREEISKADLSEIMTLHKEALLGRDVSQRRGVFENMMLPCVPVDELKPRQPWVNF